MTTELEKKMLHYFADACILKNKETKSVFSGMNLPSFIKDFIIKRYTDRDGRLDKDGLWTFLERYLPKKDEDIPSELLKTQGERKVLTNFFVSPDISKGIFRFSIDDLKIKLKDGIVSPYLIDTCEELKGGEHWGTVTLHFVQPEGKEKGYIELSKFYPFRPYKMNLESYRFIRSNFTTEEWIDVLLRAMEYEPSRFESTQQKLRFISRLLVFVEPNLNLVELAPPGTGKSFVFGTLSKHGWMVSGGVVSRARLFYDMQQNTKGAIARYDFVTMDEIHKIRFTDPNEIQSALQTYLEFGWTTVGNVRIDSKAGLMLLGNIDFTNDNTPRNKRYFSDLPEMFSDPAFLDRFHGFIEGWLLPRITEDMLVNGWTLNAEYFTETLSMLREQSEYAMVCNELITVPKGADLRDTKAVMRIATGLLKLLFPHVAKASDISKEDFNTFCFLPAMHMRSIIRKQIHIISPNLNERLPALTVL